MRKIKDKFKKWFLEKPKKEFWMKACYTFFFFRYVVPNTFIVMTFFILGAQQPDLTTETMNPIIEKAADNMANSFTSLITKMFESGQNIALNNPLAGQIVAVLYYGFVYAMYGAMIFLIIDLLRYFTAWIYKKFQEQQS